DNTDGQLGDGTTQTRFRPVSVLGIDRLAPTPRTFIQISGCAIPGGSGLQLGPVWAQHPAALSVSCNGVIHLHRIRWQQWGSATARATGTIVFETCNPNCAEGPTNSYPATLVATKVE